MDQVIKLLLIVWGGWFVNCLKVNKIKIKYLILLIKSINY